MSELENSIQLLSYLEAMAQRWERIEKMLLQHSLPYKEVFNSKETALYMGRSVSGVYKLCKKSGFPCFRPNGGRLSFNRKDVYNWMMTDALMDIPEKTKELHKLAILQHQRN